MAEATTESPPAPPAPPTPPPPPPANETPKADDSWKDGVDDKFLRDTPQATLKAIQESYKGLEKKLGQPNKGPLSLDAPPEPGSFEEAAKLSGLDVKDVLEHYAESGELDAAHADKLSRYIKPGMAKEMVEGLAMRQQMARQQSEANMAKAVEAAGGQGELDVLIARAQAELSPDDIEAMRPMLEDGDGNAKSTAPMAVRMIQNMLNEKDGTDKSKPLLASGGASKATGVTIRGPEDLNALMADEKYKTDDGYRKQVINAYNDYKQGR